MAGVFEPALIDSLIDDLADLSSRSAASIRAGSIHAKRKRSLGFT
jgi:hypothetical protein